jgi:antirestriction protein
MNTTTTKETAKIYVGTYSKYNEGSLFGKWMDLSDYSDKAEFINACLELHKDEADPELMFQDWENIPSNLIGESYIAESFWTLQNLLSELSDLEAEAFNIWLNNDSAIELDENSIDAFRDSYCGHYVDGMTGFADECIEEGYLGEIPEHLKRYIDTEAYGRDRELGGDYWESEGHVFRSN